MKIGSVKEIKNNEFRVGLTPDNVKAYVSAGHQVYIEKGAGLGSGYADEEYAEAGAAMVDSAFTAPHVTEFLQVDVTKTVKVVQKLRQRPEFADVKVSPLLLVARALLIAVRRHPRINASWDEANQEVMK